MEVTINELEKEDYGQWLPLWQDYLIFYQEKLPDEITQLTWQRLLNQDYPYFGLVARDKDKVTSFIHFTYHPSSWSKNDHCYIEDLFVSPEYRRQQLARKLMAAVYVIAQKHGSDKIHWITQESNKAGQKLYSQIAKKVDYVRFEYDLH